MSFLARATPSLTKITRAATPCISTIQGAVASQQQQTQSQTQTQNRSYWREVLRSKANPEDPSKIEYEDLELMAARVGRAQQSERILNRARKYDFYEKPWMTTQKRKQAKLYNRDKRVVEDMKRYVKYVMEVRKSLREGEEKYSVKNNNNDTGTGTKGK
eukprot:146333_1